MYHLPCHRSPPHDPRPRSIRHGESTWNDTFNKGNERSLAVFIIGFFPNLIKAVVYESLLLITGQRDSWFYDAPLNDLGLRQCDELHKALKAVGGSGAKSGDMEYQQSVATLRGEPGSQPSVVVSSNLRRAISTVAVALRDRFGARASENVKVLTCLQEISRNPDTLSLTPAGAQPVPSWIERGKSKLDSLDFASFYAQRLDVSQYEGNKKLKSTGGERLQVGGLASHSVSPLALFPLPALSVLPLPHSLAHSLAHSRFYRPRSLAPSL